MFVLSPALRHILHTSMARYSLLVLKVPLNTQQANKQTVLSVMQSCTTLITDNTVVVLGTCT